MLKAFSCLGALGLFPVSAFFFFDHQGYEAAGFMALALMLAFLAWFLVQVDNYFLDGQKQ